MSAHIVATKEFLPCLPLLLLSHGSHLIGLHCKVLYRKLKLSRGERAMRANRDEVTVHVTKFGPWALLFFRPHDLSLYPPLQEMAIPLTDTSGTERKLKVGGFLCTDTNGEHGCHY